MSQIYSKPKVGRFLRHGVQNTEMARHFSMSDLNRLPVFHNPPAYFDIRRRKG